MATLPRSLLPLALLVLPSALAQAAPRRIAEPPPAAAARKVSVAPPPVRTALDDGLAWPVLSGSDDALDITRMVRSRVKFSLAFDRSWLELVGEAERELLLRVLAVDPRWRVAENEGVLAATQRLSTENGWEVGRTGYHSAGQERWRVVVRFEPWGPEHEWATSSRVVHAGPDAGSLDLVGFVEDQGSGAYGARTTALSVQGSTMGVDVYEMGPDGGRPRTLAALPALANVFGRVLASAERIAELGLDGMPLPPGEPSSGTWLEVSSAGPGWLDVRGRVNPGAAGWTWVRLVAPAGVWAEPEVGAGTRERIGWSEDPARSFWIQGRFPVPPGPAFPATAEVWLQPDDGGAPRKIAELPVGVPER